MLVPVAARNSYVGGGFYVTTSQFGPNFYIGNNPAADGTYQSLRFGRGAPEYERQDATELAEHALGQTADAGGGLELLDRQGARLHHVAARRVADADGAQGRAARGTRPRCSTPRARKPRRVVAAAARSAAWSAISACSCRSALFGVIVDLAAAIAALGALRADARLRRERRPLLRVRALPLSAGAVADRCLRRPASPAAAGAGRGTRGGRAAPGALAAVAAMAVFANWPMLSTTLMRAVTETNLGAALQAEGRLDEAIDHYHRAIALAPDYPPAYNNLGDGAAREGPARRGDRRPISRRSRVRPDYPGRAVQPRQRADRQAGRPAEATDHFRVALQTIPASADVHNNLGIALMDQGKCDEAIAEFRAALAARPRFGAVAPQSRRRARHGAALRRGRSSSFAAPSQLDPTDASIHYDLGSLLLEVDRLEEAIAEFRAALQPSIRRSAKTHNNLGIALGSQGRMDEAIDQFRQALAMQPDFADAQHNLAIALQVKRRVAQA